MTKQDNVEMGLAIDRTAKFRAAFKAKKEEAKKISVIVSRLPDGASEPTP